MSITFKIVLDERRLTKTNQYPLRVRIYEGVRYKEQTIGIKILSTDWDAVNQLVLQSNSDHKQINAYLNGLKSKLNGELLLAQVRPEDKKSVEELLHVVRGKTDSKKQYEKTCLICYGRKLAEAMTGVGRVGNAVVYNCAVNKLQETMNLKHLSFDQLTYKQLSDFQNKLLLEGIKVNSISNYLRTIRAIYNRAIAEGLINASKYPFRAFKIRSEKTPSRSLALIEIRAICQLEIVCGTPEWYWRSYFLLSFCLIGMNMVDLLTLTRESIVDGRVQFKRKKTHKYYSIRLHPQAASLINSYQRTDSNLVLPVLKATADPVQLKKDVNQARKTCNEYLEKVAQKCGITKNVTTYYARYTWANIARSLGYSKDAISEALGHAYGNSVTSIYLDAYESSLIDAMNAAVINAVFDNNGS